MKEPWTAEAHEAVVRFTAETARQTALAEARDAISSMVTERELRSPSGCDVDIHDVLLKIDTLAARDS